MPDPLWGLLHYNVSMWHSKDLISIRFPRPQINPSPSLYSPTGIPLLRIKNREGGFMLEEKAATWKLCQWTDVLLHPVIFLLVTVTFHFTHCWLSLWPWGHPSCKRKKEKVAVVFFFVRLSVDVETAAGPQPQQLLGVILALSTPSAPLYRQSQQRSNCCWRDLWWKSGMWNPQLFFWTLSSPSILF